MAIYRVAVQPVGTDYKAVAYVQPTPTVWTRWIINIYDRSGGLKKIIEVGQENSNLLYFEYERNQNGCGTGLLDFSKFNFPIDADDKIQVFFNGTLDYSGYVEIMPDVKGGEVKLNPLWVKTQKRYTNSSKTYTNQTPLQILTDLFTVQITNSGILWNPALVDTGSSTQYTVTYSYAKMEKIITDMMGKLSSDRYWGVDENGYFFVKQLESSVTAQLFGNDYPAFTDMTLETDISGIKATRFINVYIKNTGSSGTTRVGQVGYGGSYPSLAIENQVGIIEDELTVPDEIGAGGATNALNYAYALLQSYVAYQPISVNKVYLDRYKPIIGKKITVQDKESEILYTLLDCETVTGWTNATLDTTIYKEGSASVKFTATNIGDFMEYNFLHQINLKAPQKLGFMVRSSVASGLFLSVKVYMGYNEIVGSDGIGTSGIGPDGIGDGTGNGSIETVLINSLNISVVAEWFYFYFPMTISITQIRFEVTGTPSQATQINIDRIQVFQTYSQTYTKNVVQYNVKVTPSSEDVTVKLNTYDRSANAEIQKYRNQINAINTVITN